MSSRDPPSGYGWVSIALHWLTAIAITVLLFAGASIGGEATSSAVRLHVSVAALFYLLLWGRIAWRVALGHPRPPSGTGAVDHFVSLAVHYALLCGLAVMLVSGPIVAWSGHIPVSVFGWFELPAVPVDPGLFAPLLWLHGTVATLIGGLVTLHVLGVLKHVVVNRDGVFDRIMVPGADEQTRPSDLIVDPPAQAADAAIEDPAHT